MSGEKVVPIFPCRDLKETLQFYTALGFVTTYEQHAPYVYGAVQYEDIHLHFNGSKNLKPNTESSHIALVTVSNIVSLHKAFSSGIKTAFGKQLRRGIPRLGTVNTLSKDSRFNMLDPSGNRLIVVQVRDKSKPKQKPKHTTPLTRAIQGARLDAYSREEPAIAASYLDEALTNIEGEPTSVCFRAFVLRADVAAMLDDAQTLNRYVLMAKTIDMTDEEKLELTEEIERFSELENQIQKVL